MKEKTTEELKTMADALEELQLNLEPVRDKALDQKAYYTGYAQCAEQMIKVIIAKMNTLRNQAKNIEDGVVAEEQLAIMQEADEKQEEKQEVPLIVDDKPKRKKKKQGTKT